MSQHRRASAENSVPANAQVFEDNFNVLSQIINTYPTTNYTDGLNGSETDSSLGTSSQEHEKKPLTDSFKYYLLILFSSIYLIYVSSSEAYKLVAQIIGLTFLIKQSLTDRFNHRDVKIACSARRCPIWPES